MTNGYTITIAILLLVLIVLIVRFILMHGSPKTPSCDGNCFGCNNRCLHLLFSDWGLYKTN